MKILITGATGQAGKFLTAKLSAAGHDVYGLVRRAAGRSTEDTSGNAAQLPYKPIYGDIQDAMKIFSVISRGQFGVIFSYAAQSHVGYSFENPQLTMGVNVGGHHNILEAVRQFSPQSVVLHASSSEMMGKVIEIPQDENTPFYPRSPYGVSKTSAHFLGVNYRESYGINLSNIIHFNYESEHRPPEFVSRKITRGVARIYLGLEDTLALGNLDAKRDWMYAGDAMDGAIAAMDRAVSRREGDDFVIGTGETRSVRDFCEAAFACVGLDYRDFVTVDKRFYRPTEVDLLLADPTKAASLLSWAPKVSFPAMVVLMVDNDLKTERFAK